METMETMDQAALEGLPIISDAMARGEISYSKVRSLTRAATADNEAELLENSQASCRDGTVY